MKNLLVTQSGGPTAAINSTLAGVVERALASGEVERVYGGLHGIKGVMEDKLVRLDERLGDPRTLQALSRTPSAALGSCRLKLPEDLNDHRYEAIFQIFQKYDIGCFVCIGGNDSMDTVAKLTAYKKAHGIEDIAIMGAPKTVDNDLCGMDHSPGFGSAARYIATTVSEIWCDLRVYDVPAVTIVEVMGRHVGWLAASSALARLYGEAPQLIYLPEVPFQEEHFLADVQECMKENPAVMVVVSEGISAADGSFVGESGQSGVVDNFGHKYLSGAARVLESTVRERLGCKSRSVELNLMQRCAAHLASPTDLAEARMLGLTAADRAIRGVSGEVAVLRRVSDTPYRVEYDTVPVTTVANQEKPVPREWINERGNFVNADMMRYLIPLACADEGVTLHRGLPVYPKLF